MVHPKTRPPTPTVPERSPRIAMKLKGRRVAVVVNEDPTSETSAAAANDPSDM
jgi:hypothetical protein